MLLPICIVDLCQLSLALTLLGVIKVIALNLYEQLGDKMTTAHRLKTNLAVLPMLILLVTANRLLHSILYQTEAYVV